ncbi:MAG: type II TA system antitoxin MqsA family protein [Dehalococcoidia bacterium]
MRCLECGAAMRPRKKQRYQYRESGLEDVWIEVTVHVCPKCGETLPEISDVKGLHALIADRLFQKATSLTGAEVRFLRKQMGMKAKDCATLLGVSPVTVSRWETGTERVGDTNDRLIRCLYLLHRIEAGREVRPRRSFKRILEDLSQLKEAKTPRPLDITIPAEVLEEVKAVRRGA